MLFMYKWFELYFRNWPPLNIAFYFARRQVYTHQCVGKKEDNSFPDTILILHDRLPMSNHWSLIRVWLNCHYASDNGVI